MPAFDTKLAKALQDAKSKEGVFALIYKSATEGQLLVATKAIPAGDIQAAKKQFKGAKFIEGRCVGDGEAIVFKGVTDASVLNTIQKLAKSLAGVNVKALEDQPDPGGTTTPAKETTEKSDGDKDADQVKLEEPAKDPKLSKGLREAAKEERSFGLVVGGPQEGRMLVCNKEVKAAELRALQAEIGAGKVFRGRVLKNSEGIYLFTATQRADPTLKKVIQLLAQRDGGMTIKAQMAFGPGPAAAEWETMSAQVSAQLKLLSKSPPANLPELLQKFGAAQTLSKAEEFEDALAALEDLDPLLRASVETAAEQGPVANAEEHAAVEKISIVKLQQARLRWDAVRKDLQSAIKDLQSDLAGQPPEYAELATGLNEVLRDYDESLLDELDAALNAADPIVRQKHHSRVLELIGEYRALAQADDLLAHLGKNPFFPGQAFSEVSKALQELSGQLSA